MKTPRALNWITGLAGIGLIVEFVQTRHFFLNRLGINGFSTFCDWKTMGGVFSCQAIDHSRWAELLPGFPLASFGMGYFAALLAIAILVRSPVLWKDGFKFLAFFAAFGLGVSAVYLSVMVLLVKKLCLLCLTVDAINLVVFLLALKLKPDFRAKIDRKNLQTFGVYTLALLLVGPGLGKFMSPGEPNETEVNRRIQEILSQQRLVVTSNPSAPVKGPADATVTIVKFSDFQCPACRYGAFMLHSVLEKYKDRVRFEFRNYPLSSTCNRKMEVPAHPYACDAAKAALCANRQGKFWEVYEVFFENQDVMTPEKILTWVEHTGIDREQLKACMDSPEVRGLLGLDIEEGIRVKIEATPTFFINGLRVQGGLPPAMWERLIEAELAK